MIRDNLDIYTRHFCNDTNNEAWRGEYCKEIQRDPAGWISRLREGVNKKIQKLDGIFHLIDFDPPPVIRWKIYGFWF